MQRWYGSVENVCTLLPELNGLNVYDNSETVKSGESPRTKLLLSIIDGQLLTSREDLLSPDFPEWAQAIAMVALDRYASSMPGI